MFASFLLMLFVNKADYTLFLGISSLANRTPSSWAYFAANRHLFLNPFYKPPPEYAEAKKTKERPHVTSLLPTFVTSPHLFG